MGQLANQINEFIIRVSEHMPRLDESHPVFHVDDALPHEYTITVEDTEEALQNVRINKAVGPDGISPWILKDFAKILSKPLAAIFNSSLREGRIPKLWTSATVVPIPKRRPPTSIEKDLRPISLTPIVAKVFECLVLRWVDTFLYPVVDPNQYGSLPGTCTTDALVHMIHKWYVRTGTTVGLLKGLRSYQP